MLPCVLDGQLGSWTDVGNIGAGRASTVSLRYFAPAPELRRFIAAYYIFQTDQPRLADLVRADMAQLRFMVQGAGCYGFGEDRFAGAPEISLLGPTTAATAFDVEGPALVFGIAILPMGWGALVREDASLFADSVVDGAAMFGAATGETLDALRHDPRPSRMIAAVDRLLRGLVDGSDWMPDWFALLADRWLTDAPSPSVDALVREAGVSGRQVERLARRLYGAPPKLLARKYRALRAASRFAATGMGWADAAGDAFYDQSHFIREFKRFTGHTPCQFQREPSAVTRLTLARRHLASLPRLALVS